MKRILAIVPDIISTKIALYADREILLVERLHHPEIEIRKHGCIEDQLYIRNDAVVEMLKENGISLESLDSVFCRGGMMPSVMEGAIVMENIIVDTLKDCPKGNNVFDLGALMAFKLAERVKIPAYISYAGESVELGSLASGILKIIE